MRRHATGLRTALASLITASKEYRNPVMRIGAFTEGQSEKAALVDDYRADTFAAKIQDHHLLGIQAKRPMFRGLIPPHPQGLSPEGIYDALSHVVTPTKTGERQAGILNCASVNGNETTAGVVVRGCFLKHGPSRYRRVTS